MVSEQSVGNGSASQQCSQTCLSGDVCFRGKCTPRTSVPKGASHQPGQSGSSGGVNSLLICDLIDTNVKEMMEQDGCFGEAPPCADKGVCARCYKPCIGEAYQECSNSDIYKFENTELSCDDFLDNDCDGQTDFEDSDCSCAGLSPQIQNVLKTLTRRYLTHETEGWKLILPDGYSEPTNGDTLASEKKVFTFEHNTSKVFGVSGSMVYAGSAKDSFNDLKNIFTKIDPQTKLEIVSEGAAKNLFGFSEGYWQILSLTFTSGIEIGSLRNTYAAIMRNPDQSSVNAEAGTEKQFIFAVNAQKDGDRMVTTSLFASAADYQAANIDTKTVLLQTLDSGNLATAAYFPVSKCTAQKITIDTQTVQRGVNILWVEDSSPSIAAQLQVMQAAAGNFAVALQNYNIDWQVIVYPAYVRQKIEDFYYNVSSKQWVKRNDYFYKDIERFKQEIVLLPNKFSCKHVAPDFVCIQTNSCIESPITTARNLIQQMKEQNLLDANRQIVVVMSTDTRDDSLQAKKESLQSFIDFYKSENVIVFAIHPMIENVDCAEGAGKDPAAAQEYRDLVAATNGEEANICGNTQEVQDFLAKIPEKLDQIVASIPVITLTETFIPATLTVFYEDNRVPYSHTHGVYLDTEKNSIMYGSKEFQPKDQQNVSIQYQIWEKRELSGI